MILGAPGVGVVAALTAWMVVTSEDATGGPSEVEDGLVLLVAALVAAVLVQAAGAVLLVWSLFPAGMRLELGIQVVMLGPGAVVVAVAMFWNGQWLMSFVLLLVAPWLTSIMVVSTDIRVRPPADATSH